MKRIFLSILVLVFINTYSYSQVTQINSNNGLNPTYPLAPDKTILVSDVDNTIWVTNGTAAGTTKLSTTIFYEGAEVVLNGLFIFKGSSAATGIEMFVTDGTTIGTKLLSDIYPGIIGSEPDDEMAVLGGKVYFTALRPAEGRELWQTDGTPLGTTFVKDIIPGPTSSNLAGNYNLMSNGSFLLLAVNTASEGNELWKSDGSASGTSLLKNINTGTTSSDPDNFYVYNNLVFFQATDDAHGREYWKTDGSPAGTSILKDINPGIASAFSMFNFSFFYLFNGKAYFIADNGVTGDEIWSTDGTEANTTLLKDIQSGPIAFTALFTSMKVGNNFFFSTTNAVDRFEIWQSNGTTAGTQLFMSFSDNTFILPSFVIDPNSNNLNYTQPLFQGNKFFFISGSAANGDELWVSDGTIPGTHLVKDINPDSDNGILSASYIYTASHFYFTADNGVNGEELWKTDGTEAGTSMVFDVNPGPGSSEPSLAFFINNGKLMFTANNGDNANRDLYVVNGTITPLPVRLIDFTVTPNNADAFLRWSTAQEVNSKDFVVQRSDDGVHFVDISSIEAGGNSSLKRFYSFVDPGILNSGRGMVYYRLNFRDKDGASTLSNVIALNLKGKTKWNVRLLNNPAGSILNMLVSGVTTDAQFTISNIAGVPVYKSTPSKANGQVSLPIGTLPAGVYLLISEINNERKTTRFIKQ